MGSHFRKFLLTWGLLLPLFVAGQDLSGEIVSISQASCTPPFVGDIIVTGIDGSYPYTYTLDATTVQSSGSFSDLVLGNHTIVISDALGDEFNIDFSIEINNQLLINIMDLSNVTCFGDTSGYVSVVASSGISPFQFSIDGGLNFQSNGDFNNLSTGVYEIIGQDGSGCYDTVSAEIIALSHINILSLNKNNIVCNGEATGSVQVLGEMGTSPYQYSMDGMSYQASGSFANIISGSHQFWIEDLNGCLDSILLDFSEPAPLLMQDFLITSSLCFNDNTAEVSFSASGGSMPYIFQMDSSPSVNSPLFENVSAGNHLIKMTDNNGCETDSSIFISQPDSLYINFDNITIPQCYGGSDGSIDISAIGGIGPYEFKIGTSAWSSSAIFSGLSSGVHSFSVKDQNSCVFTADYTLGGPPQLILSLSNKVDVYCNTSTNGSIDISASGGTPPYNYSINAGPFQSSNIFTSLSSGIYSLIVQDNNLCTQNLDVEILETTSLSIDSIVVDAAICGVIPAGEFTIFASGGLPSYTYSIDGGIAQASNVFLNVPIGSHTITLFASDGCSVVENQYLNEASPVNMTVFDQTDPLCEGGIDGSIEFLASGGTAAYTYSMDGGVTWQASAIFSGITDSTYQFSVSDQFSCAYDTLITFEEQSNLSILLNSISAAICTNSFSGSIDISGQNGVIPYSYSHDGSAFVPTSIFNGLDAGDHPFTIMDANTCEADTIFTIIALETPSVTIDSLISPTCNGSSDGVIQVSPGGTEIPYLYSLNAAPFSPTNYFTGLLAGTYTLDIQDNNNCQASINLELIDIPSFSVSVDSITNVLCKNEETGVFYYSFSGGLAPYTVRINNGVWQLANGVIPSLFAGNYNLDFMDSNGCMVSITEQITEPATEILVQILSVVNVECTSDSSGSVFGFASNGSSPYVYSLDNSNFQSSSSFSNLPINDYVLYAKDDNGCVNSEIFSISASSPISLLWDTIVAPSCDEVSNGAIDVTVISGSSSPFTYSLNAGPDQNTSAFSNLSEGCYLVKVVDENGCFAEIDTVLNSISDLSIFVDSTQNIICVADSSGEIWLNANGGTPAYSYFIDGIPLAGNNLSGLNNGVYHTWVTDAVGCSDSTQVAVLQESLLQGSILSQQNILCNNGGLGSVTVDGATGTSPYQFAIDGVSFSSDNTFSSLPEGDYVVTIQDASNCQTEVDVSIQVLIELNIQTQSLVEPTCFGLSDASIEMETTNGIGPYSYSFDGGVLSNDAQFSDLEAGYHSVFGIDSQGCSDFINIFISDPQEILIVVDSLDMGTCYGSNDAFIAISATNIIGTAVYNLLPNDTTNSTGLFTNLDVGVFTLSVVDDNLCYQDSIIEIISPSLLELSIDIINPLTCYGDADAIVEVSAIGGVAPYEYIVDSVSNGNNRFINNLNAGFHNLVVVDQNNCQTDYNFEIEDPDSIYLQLAVYNDITCFGLDNGTAFFLANGGTGDLSYNLNFVNSVNGVYDSLSPGPYSLLVNDSSLCSLVFNFDINEPSILKIDSILVQSPTCNGDTNASFLVMVSGGVPNYNYFVPGIGSSNDSLFVNLSGDAYYISITDANACNTNQIVSVEDPEVYELGLSALSPPNCYGDSSATVILQGSGGNGNPIYGLEWNDLTSNNIFDNLYSGMATFYSTDTLGCKDSLTVFIPEVDSLNFSPDISLPSCFEYDNGSVQFSAFGGSDGFEYSMDQINWDELGSFNNLTSGYFDFYLMDSHGCLKDTTLFIDQPDSLYINFTSVYPITCSDPNSGVINIEIIGGTSPYLSMMDTDSISGTNVSFTSVGIGSYQITTVDNNLCFTSADTALSDIDSLIASINPVTIDCYGDNNGVATVSYSGGSGDYLFLWDNQTSDEEATTQANLVAGVNYTVYVRDSLDLNCFAIADVTPTQPAKIEFELFPFSSSCNPSEIWVSVELVSGGIEPFEFSLNDEEPVSSGIFSDLSSVSTQFSVIDSDGCSEDQWIIPENPNTIDAYFEVSDDVVSMAEGNVIFTDLSANSIYLKWDFGDNKNVEGAVGDQAIGDETTGSMSQPNHNYISYGQYNAVLTTMSDFGCEDSYEKMITVEEDQRVYIPNSFTPDGDGYNDIFMVEGSTVQEKGFTLTIYDRGGKVVFQSFDLNQGWDGLRKNGSKAQPLVYVFMVTYYSGDKPYEKTGTVTLIR